MSAVHRLSKALGYTFKRADLLEEALTHRSVSDRNNNERLEFLGDSILNAVISERLFHLYPHLTEGQLSRLRATLVCGDKLAELAAALELGNDVRLGVGEVRSGGHRRQSILADTLEALIAAIYLDGGMEVVRACILNWYGDRLSTLLNAASAESYKDPKSQLQEYLQAHKSELPIYEVIDISGKAHDQTFQVRCQVPGMHHVTQGVGSSRRTAEQEAASAFLDLLKNR